MEKLTQPGDDQWRANIARSFEEDVTPSGWWYISFAEPNVDEGGTAPVGEGFLGGLYIDARSLPEALTRSHLLGLNPGGQATFVALPEPGFSENVPEDMRRRLLTKEEVLSI